MYTIRDAAYTLIYIRIHLYVEFNQRYVYVYAYICVPQRMCGLRCSNRDSASFYSFLFVPPWNLPETKRNDGSFFFLSLVLYRVPRGDCPFESRISDTFYTGKPVDPFQAMKKRIDGKRYYSGQSQGAFERIFDIAFSRRSMLLSFPRSVHTVEFVFSIDHSSPIRAPRVGPCNKNIANRIKRVNHKP